MTIKEFFSFKQNKFFWINLIAMVIVVALVLFGVLKGLDIYTRHGEAVVVPNVKGMGVAEAEKMFPLKNISETAHKNICPSFLYLDFHL
mgnify:CR=1 FL=1